MSDSSTSRVIRYIISGDSKTAVKAMEDTEKASDKTGDSVEKTGDKAEKSSKHIGLLSKAFGGMKNVIGYGASALGLGAVAFGLKDVVQAGKQAQEVQVQLQNALKNTGERGAGHLGQINKAVERSSTHGGFSPIEETRGITQLLQFTGKATTAIKLNASAVNLARGAHLEYSQALKLVARAQAGTAGRAEQYLGIIQPVKTYVDQLTEAQKKQNPELLKHAELLDKQATAMEINRVILEKYKGATSAYGKTASGAISNAKNVMELLVEKIGKGLNPIIAKLANFMAKVAQGVIKEWPKISKVAKEVFGAIGSVIAPVVKWLEHNKDAVMALVGGLLVLKAAFMIQSLVEGVSSAIGAATLAFQALTGAELEADAAAAANPFVLIAVAIAAVAAGVIYAYIHFKTFRDVVNAVFSAVKTVVVTAVDFIAEHWKLFLAGFAFPVLIVVEIIKNFTKIKKGVESIFGDIGKFISGVFNGVVSVVEGAINLIIKAINTIIAGYNYTQKHIPLGLGAAHIEPLGELGVKHAAAPPSHSAPARGGAGKELHVHVHIGSGGGREIAKAIVRDGRAMRELTEGSALYTSKLQARS